MRLQSSQHQHTRNSRRGVDPPGWCIALGESIRYDHDLVIRNSTKLWECYLGLSWLCGSPPGCCIARSSDLSPNCRVSLFRDFPEGMYSATTLRTTLPVKRVLFSQSRRPVSDRVRPPQEESTRKMVHKSWFSAENSTRRAAFCIVGSGYGASQTLMHDDRGLGQVSQSCG